MNGPYQEHKLSLHTPHKKNGKILYASPLPLLIHISISLPLHSLLIFLPFSINIQKGSLHQKEEIIVDKWGQKVGKSLAYRIPLLSFLPNQVCNTLSQDSSEVSIFSSYLTYMIVLTWDILTSSPQEVSTKYLAHSLITTIRTNSWCDSNIAHTCTH